MSYLYSLGNAYGGRTETDHILASVKEQEIQFQQLSKQLEEEHNTVVHQLEKCKLNSNPEKINNKSLDSEPEESDTESKRDSLHERKPPHHEDQIYQQVLRKKELDGDLIQRTHSPPQPKRHSEDFHRKSSKKYSVQPHSRRPRSLVYTDDKLESPVFETQFYPAAVRPFNVYQQQPNVVYSRSPTKNLRQTPNELAKGYYPYFFDKPDPMIYANHSYQRYPLMQPFSPQPIITQNYHQVQRPTPISKHAPAYYNLTPLPLHYDLKSPAAVHSPQYDLPPPVPPRDHTYHPPYHYQDTSHHFRPNPQRSSFRYPKSSYTGDYQNFSEFSPVGHQPFRQNNDKEVSRNLQSPQYYPHYQAESTPVYSAHSKPHRPSSTDTRFVSPRVTKPSLSRHKSSSAVPDNTSPKSGDPEILEVIKRLKNPSNHVVANAAAYIQHVTFGNDEMKTFIRDCDVIPILINLLYHGDLNVQLSACGALRNMVFGKKNEQSKLIVKNCGGVASLAHVMRTTNEQEMQELISGVLWNLSSCEGLKIAIADSAMPVLASRILIFYVSMLEPERMIRYYSGDSAELSSHNLTHSDLTIDPQWSNMFISATGCLRNISSAGVEVRTKMRSYDGLIEALLLVIEHVIGRNDVDSKGVENCMCILRNLSYRLASEVQEANSPLEINDSDEGCTKDDDCWRRYRKKGKKRSKNPELISMSSHTPSQISLYGVQLLWQPGVVRRYLALLSETGNVGTLEAASGALQNLSAGQWTWSAAIRTAVRKEKGLPMLVEFLAMDNMKVVTVMCSTLRNMALDERNKQLIGKHAIGDFVELLPESDSVSSVEDAQREANEDSPVLNLQEVLLYDAVCCALKELVKSNEENALRLYNSGAVSKLIEISRGKGYRYPHRIVKSAGRVLAVLWEYKNLRSLFKQQGWTQFHFNLSGVPSIASAGSQVTPLSSPPLSPTDSSKETNSFNTTHNKVPLPSPSRRSFRSHSPHQASFQSPRPDANYVMLTRNEHKQVAESLV